MDIYRYIDVNCERTQDGLFDEPLNSLTGLSYIVVAYMLYRILRTMPQKPFLLKFMIGICVFISIGSVIFHTSARMWGALLDSLPIAIFAVVYMFAMMRHLLGLRWYGILAMMAAFVYANILFKYMVIRAADGYISILPTLGFIALITAYMWLTKKPSRKSFLLVTLVSGIAVYFRILDRDICATFPAGTHFVWHLLMAVVIYNLNAELFRNYRFPSKRG